MKFKIKIISILIILSLTSVVLMGCDSNEMEVFNGIMKAQKMTSYESDTNIKVNVNVNGLTEQEKMEAEQILYMINNSDITIHQKVKGNEDQTKAKAQVDLALNLGGMLMDMGVWVDTDLSGDEMVIKEVFKLPPMAMMSMPPEYRNKEYLVLDLNELMNQDQANSMDLKELMKLSKEFQPMAEDFIKSYVKDFGFDQKIITYKGEEVLNREPVKVYELKFDDQTFKDFLRYSVHAFIESDATEDFMKDYFELIVKVTESMDSENQLEKEEMDIALEEMSNVFSEESRTEILATVDEFFDKVKDINILGEKGLTISYKMNDEGYILNTNGIIHLNIKPSELESITMESTNVEEEITEENNIIEEETIANEEMTMNEEIALNEEVAFDIEIQFNTDMLNINNEIGIELPELTEENSFSYFDFLEAQMNMINSEIEAPNPTTDLQ